MAQATVTITASVDVSPTGIKISFEGMDEDLANLIKQAGTFTAQDPTYRTLGVSDISIQSDKVISFVDPTPPTP